MEQTDLRPDPNADREEMRAIQRRVATHANFTTDASIDIDRIAGVDQAFPSSGEVVSAAVVMGDSGPVERTYVVSPSPFPYVPGFLSFREGPVANASLARLTTECDAVLVDGNGRLHPEQAGLATHLGVLADLPTVGVAKSLLCGEPQRSIDDLAEGDRVPIIATDAMNASTGTIVGYAVQTRQYEGRAGHVNPIFVSPGHRFDAESAVDVLERWLDGYKLPEPIRAADRYADTVARRVESGQLAVARDRPET